MKSKGRHDYDVASSAAAAPVTRRREPPRRRGLKTVVIEGGEEVGGLCILRGCMPTKALALRRRSHSPGPACRSLGHPAAKTSASISPKSWRARMPSSRISPIIEPELSTGKFKFIRANARFVDAHTLELYPRAARSRAARGRLRPRRKNHCRAFHHRHRLRHRALSLAPTRRHRLFEQRHGPGAHALPESLIFWAAARWRSNSRSSLRASM